MRDNLARKPALTLVRKNGAAPPDIATIAPELNDDPVHRGKDTLRWLMSLLVVLIAYGAPLAWWLTPESIPGATPSPPAAMVVELAPAPTAPVSRPDMPPGPEQAEATPPPRPEPRPEPEIPPAPPAMEPELAVKSKLEPVPEEPPPLAEAPEESASEEKPVSVASAPPDAPREDAHAAAPVQGVSVPAINQNAIPSWQNNLMLKLNEAKRYPAPARRNHQEGTVYLRFTMDREGRVLEKSIERSAGHRLLDEETLALIDRAAPLPRPPAEMPGERLDFVVPVEFFLDR